MARYSGSGGVGRRIKDLDTPLTDAPVEFGKARGDGLRRAWESSVFSTRNAGYDLAHTRNVSRAKDRSSADVDAAREKLARRDVRLARATYGGAGLAGAAALNSAGTRRQQRKDLRNARVLMVRPKAAPAPVEKAARYYDPEHRRQRRLGMAEAGLAGGGAAAGAIGVRGVTRDTKKLRDVSVRSVVGAKDSRLGKTPVGNRAFRVSGRNGALVLAGGAGLGAAGVVRQKAEGRKFGIWR